jgi:hypothetical protein
MIGLLLTLAHVFPGAARTFENDVYWSAVCQHGSASCSMKKKSDLSANQAANSHAYGMYNDEVNKDGWGKLWVHGDETTEGWYQAGFTEGSLTSLRVYQHFTSWYSYQFSTPPTPEVVAFILEQYDYAVRLVAENPDDPYYTRLGQILAQFEGVLAGINYAAEEGESLSKLQLLLLEASGDLYDIIPAMNPSSFKLHPGSLPAREFFDEWHRTGKHYLLIRIARHYLRALLLMFCSIQ